MSGSFTPLHVASGYSLRYGASSPAQLVALAAEQAMTALALNDRDGLYGAVKFAQACTSAGISPVLGVDLAVESSGLSARLPAWAVPPAPSPRTPVRGGASVDPRHPRRVSPSWRSAATALPGWRLVRGGRGCAGW